MNKLEASRFGLERSIKRSHEKKAERVIAYNKNPTLCKYCNKPFTYEKRKNRFCNHSCAQSFNNRGIRRHGEDPKKCLNCGKEFRSNANYFCSMPCCSEYAWKKWCQRVDEVGFFEGYDGSDVGGNARKPKKYILDKQDGKCALCGINSWQGKPVPFVLDHKNGDSTDWNVENIRVICRNCDGQLPTYCGKNKGKGKRLYSNSRDRFGNNKKIKISPRSSVGSST